MKHLATLIHRSMVKVYLLLTLCCLLFCGFFLFSASQRSKIQTMNEQLQALTLAEKEAAASYFAFADSQKTPEPVPAAFAAWLVSGERILRTMPEMEITLKNIEKSGRAYYQSFRAPEAFAARLPSIVSNYGVFRKQMDDLSVPLRSYVRKPSRAELQVMGLNYWEKSLYYFTEGSGLWVFLGLWLLACALLYKASADAARSVRLGNEEVLDILWTHLKAESPEAFAPPAFDLAPLREKAYLLAEESRVLSQRLGQFKESVESYSPSPKKTPPILWPQSKEQLVYIQKLLARLFTRAERAAALAKAAGSNGFQAGILALNVSIEAARAGDQGRPFLAVSDRIKDFGEKSSRIGEAIIEEIKDADLSIRKAYAAGKELLEHLPGETLAPSEEGQDEQAWLAALARDTENILAAVSRVQQGAKDLEARCFDLGPSEEDDEEESEDRELREALLESFEKLYMLSYGDKPPTHIFRNN